MDLLLNINYRGQIQDPDQEVKVQIWQKGSDRIWVPNTGFSKNGPVSPW
jgi:hypothetical protein